MNNFVIGIGSQRAGSTLLYKILDEATDVFMHPVKELHYYDSLYGIRKKEVLHKFSRGLLNSDISRIVDKQDFSFIDKRFKCHLRTNLILHDQDVENVDYLDLYRPCLKHNKVLGEITPEYMILPIKAIKKIKKDLGKDTKIILIARNPTDRFISACKLLKLYGGKSYDMTNFSDDIEKILNDMPGWVEQQDLLNDYKTAYNNYKSVFDSVLFVLYENIVANPAIFRKQLEDFLELEVDECKFNAILATKVNSIGESGSVDARLYAEIENRYCENMAYLNQKFC